MTDHTEVRPGTPPAPTYAMVRIFCPMDGATVQSRAALAYCAEMRRLGVMFRPLAHGGANLAPTSRGTFTNPWSAFSAHLLTPLTYPYVTLVCTPNEDWHKYITPRFIERKGNKHDTGCLRNVLVSNSPAVNDWAKKYDRVLNKTTFEKSGEVERIVVDPNLQNALYL